MDNKLKPKVIKGKTLTFEQVIAAGEYYGKRQVSFVNCIITRLPLKKAHEGWKVDEEFFNDLFRNVKIENKTGFYFVDCKFVRELLPAPKPTLKDKIVNFFKKLWTNT